MHDESGESMELMEEVPLTGLGKLELERLVQLTFQTLQFQHQRQTVSVHHGNQSRQVVLLSRSGRCGRHQWVYCQP